MTPSKKYFSYFKNENTNEVWRHTQICQRQTQAKEVIDIFIFCKMIASRNFKPHKDLSTTFLGFEYDVVVFKRREKLTLSNIFSNSENMEIWGIPATDAIRFLELFVIENCSTCS